MMTRTSLAPSYADSRDWGPSALVDQSVAGAIMWFAGDGLMMMILMVIIGGRWIAHRNDSGASLGPWLDSIRRQTTLGNHADSSIDLDDDDAALAAYNARLAALHGRQPKTPAELWPWLRRWSPRGVDPGVAHVVFGDQIDATDSLEHSRYAAWKIDPGPVPSTAPDQPSFRDAINTLNEAMVDDIDQQWEALHAPTCRADLDDATAAAIAQRRPDTLHEHALEWAVPRYCS